MNNDLIDVLNRLSNEIDNLRTILHSMDNIARGVDSGACSAPTEQMIASCVENAKLGIVGSTFRSEDYEDAPMSKATAEALSRGLAQYAAGAVVTVGGLDDEECGCMKTNCTSCWGPN